MDVLFNKYKVSEKEDLTIVKSDLNRSTFENIGVVGGIYSLFLLIFVFIIYFLPALWLGWVNLLVAAIVTYFIIKKFSIDILGVKILTINKKEKTLASNLDTFTTPISNINNIAIIEQSLQKNEEEKKMYQLKLTLDDGEKTLPFACTSYNVLEDLIKVIKK